MDSRKSVLIDTAAISCGIIACSAIMVSVFAALGRFSLGVIWSALAGSLIIILNYFFMSVTVTMAADKAQQGDPVGGQKMIQLSSIARLILMGGALFLGVKLGANVVALALPLAFLRPVLMLTGFFRRKEDQ